MMKNALYVVLKNFKNHAENKAGRVVPNLFLLFKEDLYEVKASGLQLNFNIFR